MAKYEYKYLLIPRQESGVSLYKTIQEAEKMLNDDSLDGFNPVFNAPMMGPFTLFRRKIKKTKGTIPPDDVNSQLLSEDRPSQQVTQQ